MLERSLIKKGGERTEKIIITKGRQARRHVKVDNNFIFLPVQYIVNKNSMGGGDHILLSGAMFLRILSTVLGGRRVFLEDPKPSSDFGARRRRCVSKGR